MKMHKLISVLLVLILSLSMLAACGGNNEAATNTKKPAPAAPGKEPAKADATPEDLITGKITFNSIRTDFVDKFEKLAADFTAKYPNAEVEIVTVKEMDNVMKVKLASNDGPDVILFNDTSIPLNSQFPDFLLPLDDMGYNGKVYFEENNTFDGKVYGLSEGGYVAGIVYNKKTFADAGITAPPTKLDELMGAFETLKSKGITPIALNFKTQWPLSYWNTNKIHEAGGDVQYREKWLETDTPFTTDSPFGKVNTLLRDIVAKGYAEKDLVNGDWEPSRTDVATGKTAMFYLGNFAVPIVAEFGAKPEDVGFIPFPVDNSGKGATSMNMDRAYGVNKNTKHPETAKAFIKFMLEDSGYNDIAGMIPTVKDLPSGIPQFAEFFDMEPTIYYTVSNSDALTTALNKGQIKDLAIMQEVILAKDDATVQAVYDKYNKIWASARK